MKLLLVNSPISYEDTTGMFSGIRDDMKMLPTGLGYLAAYVRKQGITVAVLDQYAECLPFEQVFQRIDEFKPDLIGYSATTPNYNAAINFVRRVKQRNPHIPAVMGGYHPSVMPHETIREPEVDFVVRDEGEQILLELCMALSDGKSDFGHIRGLTYKDATGIHHNPPAKKLNLDDLPTPAYDLLPMHLYSSPSFSKFATPVYQMIASRGCPFTCSFCINAEMDVSALYRRRNPELVLDEMEMLVDQYHARQIQFWDSIFTLGEKHTLEICEGIIKRGLHKKIVWSCTTRAELVTEEMVKMMVAAGCKGIGFGIESGVPELLRSVGKKSDLKKVEKACKVARRHGLVVFASFIFGFPDETRETVRQTIEFAKRIDLHYAQFSIMTPYPGTPLYKELMASGKIKPEPDNDFRRYNQSVGLTDFEPVFVPDRITAEELKAFQKDAYIQFYLRPKMVLMHLPHINLAKLKGMIISLFAVLKLAFDKTTNLFGMNQG